MSGCRYAKRHYEDVARIFRECRERGLAPEEKFIVEDVLEHDFIEMFRRDNPNFDEDRFAQASGRVPKD